MCYPRNRDPRRTGRHLASHSSSRKQDGGHSRGRGVRGSSTWGQVAQRAPLGFLSCPRAALSPEQRVGKLEGHSAPVDHAFCQDVTFSVPLLSASRGLFLPWCAEFPPGGQWTWSASRTGATEGAGRQAGALTQKPAGDSSDSGSRFTLASRAFPVSTKATFGFRWDR